MKIPRREFLKTSALSAAAAAVSAALIPLSDAQAASPATNSAARPPLIDTNVHLFEWPFRKLKLAQTPALVARLRKHGVSEAWAGSFEAMFSKDISGVNARFTIFKQRGYRL